MLILISLCMQTIYAEKMRGFVPGSECCVVMQISMRMQIIVGLWGLVSMKDFRLVKVSMKQVFLPLLQKSGVT